MIKFSHSQMYTAVYICVEKLCFCINFSFSINTAKPYCGWNLCYIRLKLSTNLTVLNARFSAHCPFVTRPTLVITCPCKRSLDDLVTKQRFNYSIVCMVNLIKAQHIPFWAFPSSANCDARKRSKGKAKSFVNSPDLYDVGWIRLRGVKNILISFLIQSECYGFTSNSLQFSVQETKILGENSWQCVRLMPHFGVAFLRTCSADHLGFTEILLQT